MPPIGAPRYLPTAFSADFSAIFPLAPPPPSTVLARAHRLRADYSEFAGRRTCWGHFHPGSVSVRMVKRPLTWIAYFGWPERLLGPRPMAPGAGIRHLRDRRSTWTHLSQPRAPSSSRPRKPRSGCARSSRGSSFRDAVTTSGAGAADLRG
jgi:hypothetical protein